MKRQAWLVGAMLAASLVGGAASSALLTTRLEAQGAGVVTASQVNIVDGAGRLRAVLAGADERGMASLAFYGPDGSFRGLVGVDSDGHPVLRFNDPGGSTRILARVGQEDGLVTVGNEAARHALIGSQGGTPFLGLSDGRRIPMQLTLGNQGQPRATLFNRRGGPGIGMAVGADDAPFLTVFDPGGSQRLALGTVQGSTVVNLTDGARARLVLGVAENGRATVDFYDEAGELERQVAADTR